MYINFNIKLQTRLLKICGVANIDADNYPICVLFTLFVSSVLLEVLFRLLGQLIKLVKGVVWSQKQTITQMESERFADSLHIIRPKQHIIKH